MNGHRKLLILAVNKLLELELVSLSARDGERGYVITSLAGENAVILWQDIGFEELRISVWWKYNHQFHPQANLTGNAKEEFRTTKPLAKQKHYHKFIGVVASGWLERKTNKHLQGVGKEKLFDIYTRRGEIAALEIISEPKPRGFEAEGKFFL